MPVRCTRFATSLTLNMNEYILNDKFKAKLLLKGEWLYDNILSKDVRIYELNFDFYYELDYENLDPGEEIYLNAEGMQFVITWDEIDEFSFKSDPTVGGLTLDEAILTAENIVKQKIRWK